MTSSPCEGHDQPNSPRTPPLRILYAYLTQGCNLACRHCWLAPKLDVDGLKYPTLGVDLLETAIVEAKPLGLSAVKLTGGEPLLHPQIMAILALVRREGLRLSVETNGVLCTRKIAEAISEHPKSFVSVSLDAADSGIHESIRGIKGSFNKAVDGIKNLVAAGSAPQIIMTVMQCNKHHVEPLIHLAEDLGAASVKFNIVQPTARGDKLAQAQQTVSVKELIELGEFVNTELAPKTGVQLHFDFPAAFRPLSRIFEAGDFGTCGILTVLGIIPTGHYALCGIGESIPELVFGKVGEDAVTQVWHEHPKLQEIRTGLPNQLGGICSRCLMKQLCMGSCLAQNYHRTGSFWEPFWFCEQADREGLFPPSRTNDLPDNR